MIWKIIPKKPTDKALTKPELVKLKTAGNDSEGFHNLFASIIKAKGLPRLKKPKHYFVDDKGSIFVAG